MVKKQLSRQTNSLCNFMQYVFFEKAGAFSRIFLLKVTLHSVRLLLMQGSHAATPPGSPGVFIENSRTWKVTLVLEIKA